MALENTCDLLAGCRRMGVDVPHIFLNQVTPPNPKCPLCRARNVAESKVLKHIEQSLSGIPRSTVYQCMEPRGLEPLNRLGQVLYESPGAGDVNAETTTLVGASNERQ
jgi:anion-transporting  ArsA/GET3 family ATPase